MNRKLNKKRTYLGSKCIDLNTQILGEFIMKTKRTLAKQSVFYGAANGIEALVPFLLAPILTRILDPTDYGIWVLFITYATFLRPFIGLSAQDGIRMRFMILIKSNWINLPIPCFS